MPAKTKIVVAYRDPGKTIQDGVYIVEVAHMGRLRSFEAMLLEDEPEQVMDDPWHKGEKITNKFNPVLGYQRVPIDTPLDKIKWQVSAAREARLTETIHPQKRSH